jgi:hypothetical protein
VWEQIDPQALGNVGEGVRVRVSQEPLNRVFWPHRGNRSWRLDRETAQVIRSRAWDQVGKHIQQRIADHFGPKVWADVWPDLRERFNGHVLAKGLLRAHELEELFERVPDQVAWKQWHYEWEAPLANHVGHWSAGTLAYCDTLSRLGADVSESLDGLMRIARSAGGWWYPLEHAVILTERPTALHLDTDGHLNHPCNAAISYPDGFSLQARHGTVLPAPVTVSVP